MPSDPPSRRPNTMRYRYWRYSNRGLYYVTICTEGKRCLFGHVDEEGVVLSPAGVLVGDIWRRIPMRFPTVRLSEFIVMPNHLHGILRLAGPSDTQGSGAGPTLGAVIGSFKSTSTVEYLRHVRSGGWPSFDRRLWQRGYYDHIIRDDTDAAHAKRYIRTNPGRWFRGRC